MKTDRNAEGIEFLAEPLTPTEQLGILAGFDPALADTPIVVPVSADIAPDTDAFDTAVGAAVAGRFGWYVQWDGWKRVGWLDKDTVLYEIEGCFAREDDIRGAFAEEALPPRREER